MQPAQSILCIMLLVVAGSMGAEFRLRWKEEFNPCNTTANCVNGLNTDTWNFEEGDGSSYGSHMAGWGNNEAQCYLRNGKNVRVAQQAGLARGVLMIQAQFHEDGLDCVNPGAGTSKRYWSSARITTRNKAAFMYASSTSAVKVEARVKIPQELGGWAAFWMLPDTPRTDCLACGEYGQGWCSSGEIDILETRNKDGQIRSTLHYGGLKDQSWLDCRQNTVDYDATAFTAYWNRVSVVWGANAIKFYVNDTLYNTISKDMWYSGGIPKADNPGAPFDKPFHLLFNLAVGGNFPAAQFVGTGGNMITDTRRAPYKFLVDWVRVYDEVVGPSA